MVKMDKKYLEAAFFDVEGLKSLGGGLYWMEVGRPIVCRKSVTLKFWGGGGSSAWRDEVSLKEGDAITLVSGGSPAEPARACVTRV